MQKLEILGFNTKTQKDDKVSAIVASTKTQNIFLKGMKSTFGIIPDTTNVKVQDFYLDKDIAKNVARDISNACLGYEDTMFIEHILNVLKNGCIVKREKGEKPAIID